MWAYKPYPCILSQTALRVWDALLSEGGKVLYRVALALLRAAEPDLVAQDNAGDVLRVAKAAAAAAHDRDALVKVRLPGPAGAAAEGDVTAEVDAGHALRMPPAAIKASSHFGSILYRWLMRVLLMCGSMCGQEKERHDGG